MAEISLPWGGIAVGDAGPYTDDQWSDVWRKLFTRDRTLQGVLPDYLNELIVSNPAGATIRVATGSAIVDGKFYDNSANVDFVGAIPGGGSNFYTVVLEKDFAGQQVRAALVGPDVVAPPAVTQADGVTWEIALATVEITSGGVITITDVRAYSQYNTAVVSAMIADLAITTAKLADGAVTAIKLTDGAGSGVDADMLDGLHGADYATSVTTFNATGDIALTNAWVLIPGMSSNFNTGIYLVIAEIPMVITGSSGQYADIGLACFLDAVQQNGEGDWQDDIDASGRAQKVNVSYAWVVVVAGVQTVQIRALKAVGSTAVVNTIWQIDKAYAVKLG